MAATLHDEKGDLYRLEISGVLRKAEFDRAQDVLVKAFETLDGRIRLLVVLQDFEGWDRGNEWSDLAFFATYGDRIGRIAIVGEPEWKDHALMFAAADLRRAPVQYFTSTQMAEARAWLASAPTSSSAARRLP